MEKSDRDYTRGCDRRKADAPMAVTALKIAGRAAERGVFDLEKVFADSSSPRENGVRRVDLNKVKLREQVAKVLGVVEEPSAEALEKIKIPNEYKLQYDRLSDEIKSRCSWETLVSRLKEREGAYLKLAIAMKGGGELATISEHGNPIFKDVGVVQCDLSWSEAYEFVYGENYRPEAVHYGYEMALSDDEIAEIETNTGRSFVADEYGRCSKSTWIDGEKHGRRHWEAYAVRSRPRSRVAFNEVSNYWLSRENRGVVRLLRVLEIK